MLLPFLRSMRILRTWAGLCDISADWSPIMGETGVDGFLVTTGWGTWGFKAIPAAGEGMAELIATGRPPALVAPFALDRFRRDHALADQASAAGRCTSPTVALRPPPARRVHVRRRATRPRPRSPTRKRATSTRSGSSTPRRPNDRTLVPRGWLPAWLTAARDTAVDRVLEVR
jgi:hypothetical protein